MKTKKFIIIGGISAILLAAGAFIYFKKKKAAEESALDELASKDEAETEAETGKKADPAPTQKDLGNIAAGPKMTQVPTATVKADISKTTAPAPVTVKATTAPAPAPVKATTAPASATVKATTAPSAPASTALPANTVKMLRTVEDTTKHQVIARVSPKGIFKVGDFAIVKGNIYNGKFKVWYVYKSHATEDAIYLETPYKGDDTGIITKI